MMRRWSTEETRVLQQYINSHVGHCDGLNDSYWSELCLLLERVRKSGDTVLQKHQVTNKIISFEKRKFPCRYILEHGTSGGQKITVESRQQRHPSEASLTMVTRDKSSPASLRTLIGHKLPARSSEMIHDHEEEDVVNNGTHLIYPGLLSDLGNFPDLQDQLRACSAYSTRAHSEARSTGHESRTRANPRDSASKISRGKKSSKKSRESRAKRKSIRYGESLQQEIVKAKSTTQTLIHERITDFDEVTPAVHEHESTPPKNVMLISKGQRADEELVFIDARSSPWQDLMIRSWQKHLILQEDLFIPQSEPLSHRDVLYMLGSISRHVNEASLEILKMFPYRSNPSSFGLPLQEVLTGRRVHPEAEDILRVSQSLGPLAIGAGFLEALLGATISLWVFAPFQSPSPSSIHHDPVQSVMDQFIEKECPKLWTSYQNLCQLHFLSSYTRSRVTSEAERFASEAYALLSAAYSPPHHKQDSHMHELSSSTAFATQSQRYQAFKGNMVHAYRTALDLSISFAKCCDLVYDFEFPKIRDKFDPSYMEARGGGGVLDNDDGVPAEDQHIAVGLLPSIWSRKSNGSDAEKARTLVTKAVVLL